MCVGILFGCTFLFQSLVALLYRFVKHSKWYLRSCAISSPPLSLARRFPSFKVWAYSLSLLLRFIVITCLISEDGASLSHMKHVCPSSLVLHRLVWHSTGWALSALLFLALSRFVLLNIRRQLWWYCALFLLRVSSMPPTSSSLLDP